MIAGVAGFTAFLVRGHAVEDGYQKYIWYKHDPGRGR